jgi:hypothetical protein
MPVTLSKLTIEEEKQIEQTSREQEIREHM